MDQHTTLGRINRSFPRHNVVVQFQGRTSDILQKELRIAEIMREIKELLGRQP